MSIFFETVLESSGFDDSYFIQIAEKSDDKIKSISEFAIFLVLKCVDEQVFGARHDFVQVKHCVRNKYLKVCTLKKTSCKYVYFYVSI